MLKANLFLLVAGAASVITAVSGATITFDCTNIPETCNNMCYAINRNAYNQMHYDPSKTPRRGRRQAAGCIPSRCQPPPGTGRTTCDEYPFASTYGTGTNGWYRNTGATTRCVSLDECRRQGGMLNAFYSSFKYADKTPVDVMVANTTNSPWCVTPTRPSDGDFKTGSAPPSFAGNGNETMANTGDNTAVYEYRTAGNRTVRSLLGPVEIGSEIFVPNAEWENNPEVKDMLQLFRRQDDDDDCTSGSAILQEAASKLDVQELGETDTIVERVNY